MAPTLVNDDLVVMTTSTALPHRTYWTKNNIVFTIVSGLLFLGIITGLLLFYLLQRFQKKRTLAQQKPDNTGLLADQDKTSMFSRHRASSITLYLDPEADMPTNRPSTDTISLVALQITALDPTTNLQSNNTPASTTSSTISSLTTNSNTTTSTTLSSLLLTPFPSSTAYDPYPDHLDPRLSPPRLTRPRTASTASQSSRRYYETTPVDGGGYTTLAFH